MIETFNALLAIVSEADEDLPATFILECDTEFVDEAGQPYPNGRKLTRDDLSGAQ